MNKFLQLESAGGILLFIMAVLAMLLANSPLSFLFQKFVSISLFLTNDGLMTFFFLLVGLELKRESVVGQLSHPSQVLLPLIAALGGMIIPACVYIFINYQQTTALNGWAIPVATDIAFALGVISLFGRKIPVGLKLFLLALAIFDDIGAILIIAFYYSQKINYFFLILALGVIGIIYLINRYRVANFLIYALPGALLWYCFLKAGIHPSITGVLLALLLPVNPKWEERLHPYVTFFIMPLFALINAGFPISNLSLGFLQSGIVWGTILGLFFGKQIGVFLTSFFLIKLKFAKLPEKSSWGLLYGVSLLCGIGFTMSLFLGTLSFQNEGAYYLNEVRFGVMVGSLLSGIAGGLVLFFAQRRRIH